ncbi:MAG: heme biosynthesis protein HemY [Alphaproteobacteria bacterium]
MTILRILIFIAVVAALAVIGMLIADEPGRVAIEWGDYLIELSPAALVGGVAALAAVIVAIVLLARWLLRGPGALRRARALQREQLGYRALTQGLVEAAAGDAAGARRLARRANTLLGEPPLTLLLSAQAAQLEGKEEVAREYFHAMLQRRETEFLGLRGLIVQASKAGDVQQARELAERAYRLRPQTPWLLSALLELRSRVGDKPGARALIEPARRSGAIGAEAAARRAAGLIYQDAAAQRDAGDMRQAMKLAERSLAADPTFLPAMILAAEAALALGKRGRAQRIIEAGFARRPHPMLARLYLAAAPGADALARFGRLERLVAHNPGHAESRRLIAEAALEAKLWGRARHELDSLLPSHACVSVHRLYARLEEEERRDAEAARLHLEAAASAPADPGWACSACRAGSDGWSMICPACGALDTIDWREQREPRGEVIEPPAPRRAVLPPAPAEAAPPSTSAGPAVEAPREPVRPDA